MKNKSKLPIQFSDAWVKEFTKALATPTFKFKRHKEPKTLYACNSQKQQDNLKYILKLTETKE